MNQLNDIIEEVLSKKKRNKFTFLTGAGISADSGIPTYRGSDGIWVMGTKYHKPEEFGTYKYFNEHQKEVWQYMLVRKKMIENAQPNESHILLADLEKILGDRFHLITQNIDNLHRRAGNENMYEIHGNYREVKCSKDCKDILPIPVNLAGKGLKDELSKDEIDSLKCPECGNWLRPNILWFDEDYDEKTNKKFSSLKVAKNSGILFIIGTSGATNLPLEIARTTLKYGGYVVDVNVEDNHFTELLKNKKRAITVRGKSSDILPIIKEQIEKSIERGV